MKRLAVLSVLCWALGAQSGSAPAASVTAVRHWSLGDVTRIVVEVSGDFHYRSDRLHNPERIYFDIVNARNALGVRFYAENVSDPVVNRIRVAEANPGTTRVVIDLAGDVRATTTQLANPGRLIIELRNVPAPAPATPTKLFVPEQDLRKPEVPKPPLTIRAGPVAPAAAAPEPLKLAAAPPPAPSIRRSWRRPPRQRRPRPIRRPWRRPPHLRRRCLIRRPWRRPPSPLRPRRTQPGQWTRPPRSWAKPRAAPPAAKLPSFAHWA